MDEKDVIDGRWKVKDELDYSGPTPTGAENWAEVGRRFGQLFVWVFTAGGVYLVTSCTKALLG